MKLLDLLARDHEKIRRLLQTLTGRVGDDDRSRLRTAYAELRQHVTEHDEAEEKAFYSALAARGGGAEVRHARAQNEAIGGALDRLARAVEIDDDDHQTATVAEELRLRMVEHIDFAESRLFPLARALFDAKEEARLVTEILKQEPVSHPLRSRLAELR